MSKPKQLSLLKDPRKNTKLWWIEKQKTYGGSLDYRKVKRPFDSRKLTHAVFKARLGPGIWFTRSQHSIQKLLERVAGRYRIKIKDLAVHKDHIHILFYTKHRDDQIKFLRLFAAEMGRKYKTLRSRFGGASKEFWIARPFTRLVSWGKKSVRIVRNYIRQNRDEAMGFVEYKPRKHRLSEFLKRWESRFDSA